MAGTDASCVRSRYRTKHSAYRNGNWIGKIRPTVEYSKEKRKTMIISPDGDDLCNRNLCKRTKIYYNGSSLCRLYESQSKGKVRSDILYELKVLCKDAGVDEQKYFFIITAFICCDLLLNLGHLADLLGHCSVNITRIYTKISLKKQKNVWAT